MIVPVVSGGASSATLVEADRDDRSWRELLGRREPRWDPMSTDDEDPPMAAVEAVRKRDGRVVPFDRAKIATAIGRALAAVGEADSSLAGELAAAVEHFVAERVARASQRSGSARVVRVAVPEIEEIQDVVERVLMELGHSQAAKSYILYREKRTVLRQTLEVRRDPRACGDPFDALDSLGRPREAGGLAPAESRTCGESGPSSDVGGWPIVEESGVGDAIAWQKGRITAALIREADIDPAVAEEIASAVEARVLRSGIRRISTALLRELVDNELFERGHDAQLRRQAAVGLPRYDLEQLLFAADTKADYAFAKTPSQAREIVADRIFRQYSLAHAYPAEVSQAHRDGRLFVHDLEDPLRIARASWLPPRLDMRVDGDVARVFERLEELEEYVAGGAALGIRQPERLLASFAATSSPAVAPFVDRLLDRLARRGATIEIESATRARAWIEGIVGLPAIERRRLRVRWRLDGTRSSGADRDGAHRSSMASAAIVDLIHAGCDLEILPAAAFESPAAGVASTRDGPAEREDASAEALSLLLGKITVNLPRAALRSVRRGRGTSAGSFEAELDDVLDLAVKGLLARRYFTARLAARRETPLWGLMRGRRGLGTSDHGSRVDERARDDGDVDELAIGLFGLNECVSILTREAIHESPRAVERAREIVELAIARASRDSMSLGARLVVAESVSSEGMARLAEIDTRLYGDWRRAPGRPEPAGGSGGGERGSTRGRGDAGPKYTPGVRGASDVSIDPLERLSMLARLARGVRLGASIVESARELCALDPDLLVRLLAEAESMFDVASESGGARASTTRSARWARSSVERGGDVGES